MTNRQEQAALTRLAQLLLRDLSQVSEPDLIQGIQDAELLYQAAPDWSGRLLARLYHNDERRSWPDIANMTGVSRTTAYRRAEPYL